MVKRKTFKPNPKQLIGREILHNPEYTDILFDGGKRAGKTVLICYDSLELCCQLEYSGIRILMIRESFNHAKLSLWYQTLEPMIRDFFPNCFDINKTDFIITNKITGSQIWIGGLDNKERTEKIFGQEYARIFLNEAVQTSSGSCERLESILAQKINGFVNQMIYDCNPRNPSHWIYKKFYISQQKGQIKLTWTPYDNIDNISDNYINRLGKLSESKIKRFRDGIWCNVEGAVYHNIQDGHITTVEKDNYKYDDMTIGVDFGYNMHCSIWGIKRDEMKASCIYEIVIIGGKTSDLIRELDKVEWTKRYKMYCDHEPDRIQELCDAGYIAVPAYKEIGAGDDSVNEFDLWYDADTNETFQSMLNLMHQQDKDGNYSYQHIKENDHGADSGRYALHGWRKDNNVRLNHDYIGAEDVGMMIK
jgi:PBSX family phage terminase large subunit